MPQVPSSSPATGKPLHPSYIHTTSLNFVDNSGRTLLLRGVNLSGASKAPVGHLSYLLEDFWESAEAGGESFVGRPLNIDDGSADVHLARLRGWGFNLLRFPFTWEALEHEGPGKYDTDFMDYTIRVLCKCRDYGFRVYMDPHQDTWSRFSGGSGAPYWTLAACGINPRHITATQAAIIHCEYPLAQDPDPASLPAMVWSTNYGRLLSQTVFTLFFAGRDFAPNCIIDNVNIQDYLQSHFIEACGQLADRIRAFEHGSLFEECIIGWDSMNEPFEGLCGWADLNVNPTKQGSTLKKGTYPTPAQSFRLGMGQAQTVENWTFGTTGPAKNGSVTIDPKGRKIWADASTSPQNLFERAAYGDVSAELPDGTHPRWGWKRNVNKWPLGTCIWAQHGVWDIETGFVLRPDYFTFNPSTGIEIEFLADFWKPHWLNYAKRIRQAHEEAIIFVQPPVFAPPPKFEEAELKGRCAYSPHYYDGLTLVTRHWNWFNADALGLLRGKYSSTLQAVKIGESAIRKSLNEQLGYLQADVAALGRAAYPTVIGEIGTPFDMDDKRSYGWTDGGKHRGDYSRQEKALDASLNACDAWADIKGHESLNWTVWTYVGEDHTHEWGDGWNMEDLSLWSPHDLASYEPEYADDEMDKEMQAIDGDRAQDDTAFDSRAVLLRDRDTSQGGAARRCWRKQPTQSLPMLAARSSLSLATLGAASASASSLGMGIQYRNRSRPRDGQRPSSRASAASSASSSSRSSSVAGKPGGGITAAGYSRNPYTLLTDGARAVRAFARPWPVKVVGHATDVRFDIGKAVFKLAVKVNWEDRIQNRPSSSSRGSRRGVDGEEEQLATEVYIPLVHYAHPRLLEAAERSLSRRRATKQKRWRKDGDARSVTSMSTVAAEECEGIADGDTRGRDRLPRKPLPGTSRADADVAVGVDVNTDVRPISISMAPTATSATADSDTTSPTASPSLSHRTPGLATKPKSLSSPPPPFASGSGAGAAPLLIRDSTPDLLDVEVKVSGGRVAVRGQTLMWWYDAPAAEGDPPLEYVLEVRRRSGVIKPLSVRGRQLDTCETWCEKLCPEEGTCIIG